MLFQTFDDKASCNALYAKNKLYFKSFPKNLTRTWSYSESLKNNKNIEYAQIYCKGKTLDEICPGYIQKEWKKAKNKLIAFNRACIEAQLDLNKHCFYDMTPRFFLEDLGKVKNKICDFVFSSYEKPQDYDFTLQLIKVLTEIKNTKLNIDDTDDIIKSDNESEVTKEGEEDIEDVEEINKEQDVKTQSITTSTS